jgi:hypothetical protein
LKKHVTSNFSVEGWVSLLPAFAGFLLGLLFNPEDGGNIFILQIVRLSANYAVLQPRQLNRPYLPYWDVFYWVPGLCSLSGILSRTVLEAGCVSILSWEGQEAPT